MAPECVNHWATHGMQLLDKFYPIRCFLLPLKSEKTILPFLANVTTLRSLIAVAIPSVCLSSVTLVRPTQAVELFGNFFHHTIAQGLYFSDAKNRWWGTPLSP